MVQSLFPQNALVGTKTGSRHGVLTRALSVWKRVLEAISVPLPQRTTRASREWNIASKPSRRTSNHVAAICYRFDDGKIEFLLVKTRAGRWTFPKGRVDDDATRAGAAAREAREEAGVGGHVEALPFTTYLHSKAPLLRLSHLEFAVDAHLCEVHELVMPDEPFRNPTWFSVERSKRRLHEERSPRYGAELARVVDKAVDRIAARHRKPTHR